MVLLVTIGLHALVIAVLMTMKMGITVFDPPALSAVFLTPEKTVEQPPPELQVTEVEKQVISVDIPQPEFAIPLDDPPVGALELPPADTGPAALASEGTPSGSVATIPATALQFTVVRSTDDYYPSQSVSLGEQGAAVVRICVTPGGRLDGRPAIESSSGSSRLDAAAIAWAREGLRFTPATRDGTAVAACKGLRVNFKLN
jgi:TonB family protein